jgi:hypothetical protein
VPDPKENVKTNIQIFAFVDSGFFCVTETTEDVIQLTYFDRQRLQIGRHYARNPKANFKGLVKLNNQSKVGWHQNTASSKVVLLFYDLDASLKGRLQYITAQALIGADKVANLNPDEHSFLKWEFRSNQYILKSPVFEDLVDEEDLRLYRHFVLSFDNSESISATLRPLKNRSNLVECDLDFLVLAEAQFVEGYLIFTEESGYQKMPARTILFDCENEKVVQVVQMGEGVQTKREFYVCEWDKQRLLSVESNMGDFINFTVIQGNLMMKEVNLQCLLHLNEDFDDDLLFDAISLLE